MNSFSNKAISFIKQNYKTIVNIKDFTSISIGGSIARGYAINDSDIDLICVSQKENSYKKIFKRIDEFQVEIHIIPVTYIYALIQNIKEYSNLCFEIPKSIDIFCMGAKIGHVTIYQEIIIRLFTVR